MPVPGRTCIWRCVHNKYHYSYCRHSNIHRAVCVCLGRNAMRLCALYLAAIGNSRRHLFERSIPAVEETILNSNRFVHRICRAYNIDIVCAGTNVYSVLVCHICQSHRARVQIVVECAAGHAKTDIARECGGICSS